ncbi:hypothetical protein GLOIN_2v1480898 [Rhizophagus irregularis DAOM 181602=DAOM 197198]|nr:hypothetical protein GLOIN_2v1480898 [Rhizophagus irregularis DAOM 181602=DAOM 197198]
MITLYQGKTTKDKDVAILNKANETALNFGEFGEGSYKIHPEGYWTYMPSFYDRRFHNELSDEFWHNTDHYQAAHRKNNIDRRKNKYRNHNDLTSLERVAKLGYESYSKHKKLRIG